MQTVVLIPARYQSTRYPGKPLAELRGGTGVAKSLIRRSWDAARQAKGVDAVYVVTDDDRIAEAVHGFGGDVIMTSPDCLNGTERCAEAISKGVFVADLVVNFQGDALLTPPWFVEELIAAMGARPDVQMATPVLRCDAETYANFLEDRRAGRVGGTTAVFGADGNAIYFSKEVIPFVDPAKVPNAHTHVFHHVGLYAYRPAALTRYMSASPSRLEELEGLEQLRFLNYGEPVLCVEVEARGRVFWELNNPEDVARIEAVLEKEGIE